MSEQLTFPIKIERTGSGSNLIEIRTTGTQATKYSTLADIILGTIGDHNRQTLQFERAPEFNGDDLCLAFSNTGSAFPEISLGQNNEYLIPNALTQESRLSLQIILRENGTAKASSNILEFALRPAITPGTAPIEPIPDPVQELIGAAFTGVSLEDDEYQFSNKSGTVVATVQAVGGGGGGGIQSIVAGDGIEVDSTDAENPEVSVSEATLDKIAGKLDKVTSTTTTQQVYVKTAAGEQTMLPTAEKPAHGHIPKWSANGELQTNNATSAGHAVNLRQLTAVDEAASAAIQAIQEELIGVSIVQEDSLDLIGG